jgi:hypothetical protein
MTTSEKPGSYRLVNGRYSEIPYCPKCIGVFVQRSTTGMRKDSHWVGVELCPLGIYRAGYCFQNSHTAHCLFQAGRDETRMKMVRKETESKVVLGEAGAPDFGPFRLASGGEKFKVIGWIPDTYKQAEQKGESNKTIQPPPCPSENMCPVAMSLMMLPPSLDSEAQSSNLVASLIEFLKLLEHWDRSDRMGPLTNTRS